MTAVSGIKLRPHHFLCMRFWAGHGYSEEYTHTVEALLPRIHADEPVTVTFGPDSLCSACPHLQNGRCESQDHVLSFDQGVTDRLNLTDGMTTTWSEMSALVTEKIMNAHQFHAICGDCAWAELCHSQ